MPLVRFIGRWVSGNRPPDPPKRLKPILVRLYCNKDKVFKGICDKSGNWFIMYTHGKQVVELQRITTGFSWYDNQVVFNKDDLGLYLEDNK